MKKILILLLAAAVSAAGCGISEPTEFELSSESRQEEEPGVTAPEEEPVPENVCVYICGAVKNPGVYELPAGSRICHAAEAAGGLKEDADLRSLNQAQLLSDGEQIIVYTEEEAAEMPVSASGNDASGTGPVNINTAGLSELMTLPGIGQIKAQAVIDYRETNGAFGAPEEICNVEGIKEKCYSRISGLITV